MPTDPFATAACGHTAHRTNDQGRQGQINGTAWEPCAATAAIRWVQITTRDPRMPDTPQLSNHPVSDAVWREIGEANGE